MVGSSCNNSFAKTICSICYEDLKPIVEDLQAISICGHVFHELCLQQWFEYCKNTKKQSCPVCKQGCTQKSVGRLYFQSIGDPICSQSQIDTQKLNKIGDDESPELLRVEVKRLEAKVSGLSSALDLNQKDLKQLNDQLQTCNEQLSKEVVLKNEALRNKECIQAMLQTKSSDLVKSNLECSRLQEKNLALVKEIAALKLVSDCNLEEEEIVKLATIGYESNAQDAIDVLKKSLVIRNKSYKELMAKCNSLGRGEARSLRKLEKAKEKIVKLKKRVQELELAIEEKDNEILRSLKTSKKRNCNDVILPSVNKSNEPSFAFKHPTVEPKGKSPTSVIDLDEEENENPFVVKETNKDDCIFPQKEVRRHDSLIRDEDELQKLKTVDYHSKADNCKDTYNQKSKPLGLVDCDNNEDWMQQPDHQFGLSGSAGLRNEVLNDLPHTKGLLLQDIRQVQPSFKSKADTSAPIPLAEPGDRCFTGGLLGPDGANRYLGKWCKRPQSKSSLGSSSNTDTLIAEGADGRGGRVKVLRSLNQASMDARDIITSAKRPKSVTKSSGMQSQGCLQMEHFFKKANK
ncbi:E3 ubiquitin-protein ligase TRAIP [Chenopodium quinoa]|uniref:E3 ubiquitin-protein ligase TRAIP n=1 Tax=Chenopodium quinoa TaxID=63459 RepID=UPI000B786737|nr:E3 ubiquitin-protein ligase TRAIP [Chenopodium quinoa]